MIGAVGAGVIEVVCPGEICVVGAGVIEVVGTDVIGVI